MTNAGLTMPGICTEVAASRRAPKCTYTLRFWQGWFRKHGTHTPRTIWFTADCAFSRRVTLGEPANNVKGVIERCQLPLHAAGDRVIWHALEQLDGAVAVHHSWRIIIGLKAGINHGNCVHRYLSQCAYPAAAKSTLRRRAFMDCEAMRPYLALSSAWSS